MMEFCVSLQIIRVAYIKKYLVQIKQSTKVKCIWKYVQMSDLEIKIGMTSIATHASLNQLKNYHYQNEIIKIIISIILMNHQQQFITGQYHLESQQFKKKQRRFAKHIQKQQNMSEKKHVQRKDQKYPSDNKDQGTELSEDSQGKSKGKQKKDNNIPPSYDKQQQQFNGSSIFERKRITNSFPQNFKFNNDINYESPVKASSSTFKYQSALDSNQKKSIIAEIQMEEDCKIWKQRCWSRTKLILQDTRMSFFQYSFDISKLEKIKMLPESSCNNKLENTIKITTDDRVVQITLLLTKKIQELPLPYFLFSKLVDKKIELHAFTIKHQVQKIEKISSSIINDSYIYGNLLKKSQGLGKWEQRLVVIKKSGIYSYRNKNAENCTFQINSQDIKYLWTRFHFISDFLIIKVKYGVQKTEFGIPITMFSSRLGRNWLYSFYKVMPPPTVLPGTQ